jgi:ornithine carbamoyltransferase
VAKSMKRSKSGGAKVKAGAGIAAKDFLTLTALSGAEIESLFATASALKAEPAKFATRLAGQSVVLLFEKPSLRTRVSFEVGVNRLGGHALFYDHSAERIGMRESLKDYARNLERFVQCIVARVYEQSVLEGMAEHARVPIVNALSNTHHPCQGLADALTIHERFGTVRGRKVVYLGDGNNVCTSLAEAVCTLGGHMTVISPKGYVLGREVLDRCRALAEASGGSMTTTSSLSAVEGAEVVYTDAWVSMHNTDAEARYRALRAYQVNAKLMAMASPKAIFMHCLPAERGDEVTDEVIDGPQSVVYDQAENRMHAQNALLLGLMRR